MIKANLYEVEKGEHKGQTRCEIKVTGSATEIITEACHFIERIRESLDEASFSAGMTFKLAAASAVFDIPQDEVMKFAAEAFLMKHGEDGKDDE